MNIIEGENKVKKINLLFSIIISLGIFINLQAGEVTKVGTTAASFLKIGIGPRANAMGQAFAASAEGPAALYWNPSGIASATSYEVMFTYTELFVDTRQQFLGAVIPAGDLGVFGAFVSSVSVGEMEVTNEDYPNGFGMTFSANMLSIGLSYAKPITDKFAVGANVKFVYEGIANSSASGLAFDIGTSFITPFYDVKLSSCISNYGTKMQMDGDELIRQYDPTPNTGGDIDNVNMKLETEQFELPLRLQIGLSKNFQIAEDYNFLIAADAVVPNDNSQYMNVGAELSLFDNLIALRGGYKGLFLDESQEGLTLGFGINYEFIKDMNISLDYSYQKMEYLDNIQSFGVNISF